MQTPDLGRLTTHVLDTAQGRPAAAMRIDLAMLHGDHAHHLLTTQTNDDGRTAQPLLAGDQFQPGTYELQFHVAAYFRAAGLPAALPFLDVVPVRFILGETAHYHVPLLVSPYGYSTYRGS